MAVPKFLSNIGHVLKVVFGNPKAIQLEAGIASILMPGFGPLIVSAGNAIVGSEVAATAAGIQNGTGAQKLEYAAGTFLTTYEQWATQNNLIKDPTAAGAITQKVFELMQVVNSFMEPATPTPATTTPVADPIPTAVHIS